MHRGDGPGGAGLRCSRYEPRSDGLIVIAHRRIWMMLRGKAVLIRRAACLTWLGTAAMQFLVLCLFEPRVAAGAEIHEAAKKGDALRIEAALAGGADVNATNGTETPLFYAAASGSLPAVSALLAHGADVNVDGKRGPPIIASVSVCRPDILKLLLEKGADPNAKVNSKTALHFAAQTGDVNCIALLVEAGANVGAQTTERETAYHFAKRLKDPAAADYLLKHGGAPALVISPIAPLLVTADPERGKKVFVGYDCSYCHSSAKGEPAKLGPNLVGIAGRQKASFPGFNYSYAMKEWGSTWSDEDLNQFVWGPRLRLPGTQMQFRGIPDDAKRADLVAYLKSLH